MGRSVQTNVDEVRAEIDAEVGRPDGRQPLRRDRRRARRRGRPPGQGRRRVVARDDVGRVRRRRPAGVAAGLRDLGVGRGDRVALMIRNVASSTSPMSPPSSCGATPFSIYNSSAPDQVQYLLSHAEAKVDHLSRTPASSSGWPRCATSSRRSRRSCCIQGEPTTEVVRWDDLLGLRPRRPRRGVEASPSPTTWPRSSTRRAPPGRPRA